MTLKKQDMRIRLAQIALRTISAAAPRGPFGRLKTSFRIFPREGREAIVYSLYYWARFVNDGRKTVGGKLMIFYPNPKDDPRISSDYPRTRGDIRRLSKEQYRRDFKAKRLVRTFKVGSITPTFFIEKGVAQAELISPGYIRKALLSETDKLIRRRFDKITLRI